MKQLGSFMGNFRELLVWRRAQDLALAVYQSTSSFPNEERYGLTAQMRRSARLGILEHCGGMRQAERPRARPLPSNRPWVGA